MENNNLVVKFLELNFLLKIIFIIQFVCFLMLYMALCFMPKNNPFVAIFVIALLGWGGSWLLLVAFWKKIVLVLKQI